jgi:hypothetical protein
MAVLPPESWRFVDPGVGWDPCDHYEEAWSPGPVQVPQRRLDGHQAVQVRPALPADRTRYWGAIAFHRVGRKDPELRLIVMIIIAICLLGALLGFAAYELDNSREPTRVQMEQ